MRGVVALFALVGCSGAEREAREPEVTTESAVSEGTVAFPFPSGTFSVTSARRVTDHCGNMQWESDTIEIDPVARTLYSTPDNRLYAMFIDKGDLVARGSFEPRDGCPTDTYVEIWRLEKESEDRLSGYVTTYSHFNSGDCLHACKAVFAVELDRAEGD